MKRASRRARVVIFASVATIAAVAVAVVTRAIPRLQRLYAQLLRLGRTELNHMHSHRSFLLAATMIVIVVASTSAAIAVPALATGSDQPPVADPGGPYTAAPGASVTLDGSSSSDPNGQPLEYHWDLTGDGLFQDSTLVKPTYTVAAGAATGTSFAVCLKVTNSLNLSATACTTVSVEPADSTPPDVTPTVTGTLGTNGWYTSDVAVSWTVTDADSAVSSEVGCDAASLTADTTNAGVTFGCSATSGGGTTTSSVTIYRDATFPAVNCAVPDQQQWYGDNVTVECNAADTGSGLAHPVDASFSLSTNVTPGDESVNAITSSRQVCDLAGNCAATAGPYSYKIDRKPPVITCNTAAYALGQVGAAVTASATDDGAGPASAILSAPADTTTAGLKSITFTALDSVGNHANRSCSYSVGYYFGGFMSPLPKNTLLKSGATIPVKFSLADATGQPLPTATASALAQAGAVEVTLTGPSISALTTPCAWNTTGLYFQCNIKTPTGLKTGAANPYTLVAQINLGAGFATITTTGSAVNPEVIYFK